MRRHPQQDKELSSMNYPTKHQVIVYFAGWNLDRKPARSGGEAAGIPWDQVTCVNHAFWAVEPADGSGETTFARRESGKGPRTAFRIVSLHPENDCGDKGLSEIVPGLPRNHFAQYDAFSRKYPQVTIFLSIGGWTRCGYFSEMAYTAEGRASFIASCLSLMREHPWIGGIDIDWEYPAGSKDGERQSGGGDDQGCPIFGTAEEDRENFTRLLSELRAAMDGAFGPGVKKLTACAAGAADSILPCQDWAAAAAYLDFINIMTYDLAAPWDGVTGHASSAGSTKAAAAYFEALGIPPDKLCVGSPLYGSSFRIRELGENVLGAAAEGERPAAEELDQTRLRAFEAQAVSGYDLLQEAGRWHMGERFDRGGRGWHCAYDACRGGAYLYNDDGASPYSRWFVSYENPLSLQEKLDYVREARLAGIIVWEASQDTADYQMLSQMGGRLFKSE